VILNLVILVLVTAERLAELALARSNTKRLLAQGAREHASGHYPLIVALHAAWLGTLWWLAPSRPVDGFWLALFALLEVGRVWVLTSLGRRWTTRIIILPGAPLVQRGPYRFLDHPNYAVVVAEIAVLPLAFGLWRTAFVFSLLNAGLLAVRIREENRALGGARLG
jgi:methyltransferase